MELLVGFLVLKFAKFIVNQNEDELHAELTQQQNISTAELRTIFQILQECKKNKIMEVGYQQLQGILNYTE